MGLTIRLQGESSDLLEQVEDPKNVLHRLLSSSVDGDSCCLQFIDWYGDTIFNRLQMKPFLDEWADVRSRARDDNETNLVESIRALAIRCQDEPHLYLRFIGD